MRLFEYTTRRPSPENAGTAYGDEIGGNVTGGFVGGGSVVTSWIVLPRVAGLNGAAVVVVVVDVVLVDVELLVELEVLDGGLDADAAPFDATNEMPSSAASATETESSRRITRSVV